MNNAICKICKIMELYAKYLSIFTSFYVCPAILDKSHQLYRLHEFVKITKEGGGGGKVNRTPPPTFDTIHPIDLIFGTYNDSSLYFRLIGTT